MKYELPTLQQGDTGQEYCEALSGEGRNEEQAQDHGRSTSGITSGEKSPRCCKTCGTGIGKGKQYCEPCRSEKIRCRERAKKPPSTTWAAKFNFQRDVDGNVIKKRCTTCDQWKAAGEFNKRKDTASGLSSFCKECEKQRVAKHHEKKRASIDCSILHWNDCVQCGKRFPSKTRNKSLCSDKCNQSRNRERQRLKVGSIHVSTHAKCKNCGQMKPIHDFKNRMGKGDFKILPTSCRKCKEIKSRENGRNHRKKPKNKPRQRLSKRFREIMNSTRRGGTNYLRDFIGCSSSTLRKHLESQFKNGMKWSNYGTKWHVDHILPVASFDHNDIEQVRKCWHYSNLRPLCAIENMEKSDTIVDCQPELLLQLP